MLEVRSFLFSVSFIALALVATPAVAEDAAAGSSSGGFSGTLTAVSDYVFRGITQSAEKPALQGSFDYAHNSGIYAGVWGSTVDFNDGDEASTEVDVYGGMKGQCGVTGLTWDIGGTYFAYPGADNSLDYDYFEAKAGLGYTIGPVALNGNVNFSPEFFADSGDAWYTQGNATWTLPRDFSLTAHAGYQAIDDETAFGVPDYTDWALGVGYAIQGFNLGLQYTDTDLDKADCGDNCDARVIFSVSRSFN